MHERNNSPMSGMDGMNTEARLGFLSSVALVAITAITFGIAVLTPPLSGPFCVAGCYDYPYTDIASRFPRDYNWMYPAVLLTALYVLFAASLHQQAPEGRKAFGLIGLSFAVMAAVVLLGNHFVQLSVVQPSLVAGETEGLALITQFNPHGIFIALDELGYLLMALSFPWLAATVAGLGGVERSMRWSLHAGATLVVALLAAISAVYGIHREYRFEVAVISIDWLVLLVAGSLAAVHFRRAGRRNHVVS